VPLLEERGVSMLEQLHGFLVRLDYKVVHRLNLSSQLHDLIYCPWQCRQLISPCLSLAESLLSAWRRRQDSSAFQIFCFFLQGLVR
jgi:hypothetical protein